MFQKHLWTVLGILVILTLLAAQCVAPVAARIERWTRVTNEDFVYPI